MCPLRCPNNKSTPESWVFNRTEPRQNQISDQKLVFLFLTGYSPPVGSQSFHLKLPGIGPFTSLWWTATASDATPPTSAPPFSRTWRNPGISIRRGAVGWFLAMTNFSATIGVAETIGDVGLFWSIKLFRAHRSSLLSDTLFGKWRLGFRGHYSQKLRKSEDCEISHEGTPWYLTSYGVSLTFLFSCGLFGVPRWKETLLDPETQVCDQAKGNLLYPLISAIAILHHISNLLDIEPQLFSCIGLKKRSSSELAQSGLRSGPGCADGESDPGETGYVGGARSGEFFLGVVVF